MSHTIEEEIAEEEILPIHYNDPTNFILNLSSEEEDVREIFTTPEAEVAEVVDENENKSCSRCEDIDELLEKKSMQVNKLMEQLRNKEGRIQSLEISIKEQGRLLIKRREEIANHNEEKAKLKEERDALKTTNHELITEHQKLLERSQVMEYEVSTLNAELKNAEKKLHISNGNVNDLVGELKGRGDDLKEKE